MPSGMSDGFSAEEVRRIAELAKLELDETEVARLGQELGAIVQYVRQIAAVDTTGVPATAQVLDHPPRDRDDDLRDGLPRTDALRNAPDAAREAGLFRAPRAIG